MKTFEATERAYKNGYEQGKKDALSRNIAKEKLIDIITDYVDFLPWETIDDMADSIMEKFATDNNVGDKWIPVSEPPKEKGCYLVNANHWWDGKPVAREAFWNGADWLSCYDKFKISQRVTHWMPLPEPPKGE